MILQIALGVCIGHLAYQWLYDRHGSRGWTIAVRVCWLMLGAYAFTALFTLLG